jgi:hypothetical protein
MGRRLSMATREQTPQAPAVSEPTFCPHCGADTAPDQEYCLQCGGRLRPRGTVAAVRTGWLRRLGWDPGERLLAVLLALLVAAAGAALAIVFSRSDDGRATLVATSEVTSQATPSVTIQTTGALPTAPTQTRPTETKPKPPPRTLISWPAGKSGYTVVLNSIPLTSVGRRNAVDQGKVALARGLSQVGVLDSSRFSSLHPGYWVVFSGVFDSERAARGQIARARSASFQLAYVRRITP